MTEDRRRRTPAEDQPPLEAVIDQFAVSLQTALQDLKELDRPIIRIQRVSREEIIVPPAVINMAVRPEPAATTHVNLYDEGGLPVYREFPRGPIGRLQLWLIRAPAIYRAARWTYQRVASGPHVGRSRPHAPTPALSMESVVVEGAPRDT